MLAFVAVVSYCSHLKILSRKQMLQRLAMALVQLQMMHLYSKMDTIFMNSENSETEDNLLPYRLLLILEDKIKIK